MLTLCPRPPSADGDRGGGGSILRREEPPRAPRVRGAGPQAGVTGSRLRLHRALLVVPRAPPACLLGRSSPHALPQPPGTPTTRGQGCSPSPACLGPSSKALMGVHREGPGGRWRQSVSSLGGRAERLLSPSTLVTPGRRVWGAGRPGGVGSRSRRGGREAVSAPITVLSRLPGLPGWTRVHFSVGTRTGSQLLTGIPPAWLPEMPVPEGCLGK